jgi:hypothetical protein
MTEGELRSMGHILLRKEETRNRAIRPPVVVWGIDLSKEPIGWKDEEVLQKAIGALREHGPLPRRLRRAEQTVARVPVPAAVPVPTAVPAQAAVPVPTAGSAPEVHRTPEETLEAENETYADEPQVKEPESTPEEVQDDDLDSLFGDGPEDDVSTPVPEEADQPETLPLDEAAPEKQIPVEDIVPQIPEEEPKPRKYKQSTSLRRHK